MPQFNGTVDQIENTNNKIDSISSSNTNNQYPNAKAVYTYGQNIKNEIINEGDFFAAIPMTASGTSTGLTLTDSGQATLNSIKVYGACEQAKTTGKNILPSNFVYLAGLDSQVYTKVVEGRHHLSTAYNTGAETRYAAIGPVTLTAGQSYYISVDDPTYVWALRLHSSAGNSSVYSGVTTGFSYTPSTDQTVTVAVYPKQTCTVGVQVEKGSSKTSFEVYTGCGASPSVLYPQDVNCVVDSWFVAKADKEQETASSSFEIIENLRGIADSSGNIIARDSIEMTDKTTVKCIKRIKFKDYDGNEPYLGVYSTSSDFIVFEDTIVDLDGSGTYGLCSHAVYDSGLSTVNTFYFSSAKRKVYFKIGASDIGLSSGFTSSQALTAFKAWLGSAIDDTKPFRLYYATSSVSEYDISSSYEGLDLKRMKTLYPQTYLYSTSAIPHDFEIGYMADMRTETYESLISGKFVQSDNPVTFGGSNVNNGRSSFIAGGQNNTVGIGTENCSIVLAGKNNRVYGEYGVVGGYCNTAYQHQAVLGLNATFNSDPGYSNDDTGYPSLIGGAVYGTLFKIGHGYSDSARKNAFRVAGNASSNGGLIYYGTANTTGADYAENYEWEDENPGNEDRRGLFVTLDGTKIRKASGNDDFILGIISSVPAVIGDSPDCWPGMYKTDVFGEFEWSIEVDEETGEETRNLVLNPDYDPEQEYTPRTYRSEWGPVGTHGKLVVVDDGTCEVNGFCYPSEGGIGTADTVHKKYRVMERLDENHVKVVLK